MPQLTPGFQTTPSRSKLMSRVRQADTPAELEVRRLLHACGVHFRTRARDLPGSPDIVNRSRGWAIFVHGCFWHGHEGCARWRLPKRNRATWRKKFGANRERDRRAIDALESAGLRVLVVWECELTDEPELLGKLLSFLEPIYRTRDGEHFRRVTGRTWLARTVTSGDRGWCTVYPPGMECETTDLAACFDQQFLVNTEWSRLSRRKAPSLRAGDLFSGCGGLSLGVREACACLDLGFEPVLAVDNDERALAVYEKNFKPTHAVREDIATVLDGALGAPPTASERSWRRKLGSIDALLAGPPCQGHSDLNNQSRRKDPRNRLYEKVGRFAEVFRPQHILIENVPAVVLDRDGALQTTLDLLRRLGYLIDDGLVDLLVLGVAQRRRRHVVVASLSTAVVISEVVEKYRVPERDLRWAIGDLEDAVGSIAFERASQLSPDNQRRVRYLFDNDFYDLPDDQRPACHQGGEHSYKSMYGRLRWTEPAQTITSGFGSPGQGRFVHPSRPRTLTPHEAARLQFFPDSFDFSGVENRTALATMIGNAVPMRLSYVFFLELLSS